MREARASCQDFFTWYNTEHYHSGVGWHHPIDVHYGHAETVRAGRNVTLSAAPNGSCANTPNHPPSPSGMDQQNPHRPRAVFGPAFPKTDLPLSGGVHAPAT